MDFFKKFKMYGNFNEKRLLDNGLVLIGTRVKAIEYYDVSKARAEKVENPYRYWRHDFKSNDVKIYGLPDGSLLIKSSSGKKLWEFR